ncbi:MAG TPA: haloacid dehalogenase-like hydrolase, partial [Calditrichia bacterium]|nr:haloacid dehalogenase-like hydrolase [Calditrichia bacterium]
MPANKLLLFDIDGTLILSGGMGQKAMLAALSEIFETPFEASITDFAGSTDRLIIHNLIERYRVAQPPFEEQIDAVVKRYRDHLAHLLSDNHHIEVMPGIYPLLAAVGKREDLHPALLTGNIASGAQIKLSPVDLWHPFPVGGFGDDAMDRNLLPPVAVQRAEAFYGVVYRPGDVWVIGDTP